MDNKVGFFDRNKLEEISDAFKQSTEYLSVDVDKKLLLVPDWDNSFGIYDLTTKNNPSVLPGHTSKVYCVAKLIAAKSTVLKSLWGSKPSNSLASSILLPLKTYGAQIGNFSANGSTLINRPMA